MDDLGIPLYLETPMWRGAPVSHRRFPPGDGEGNAKVWPTSSGLHGSFVATSVDLKGKGTW